MRFFSKPYREYIKTQTCTWRLLGYMDCEGESDPQHDPALGDPNNPGDDLDCIPMCRKHHNYHKQKPILYKQVIDETVLEVTKASMIRGFLRALDLETERAKVRVPNRKPKPKAEQETVGKWSKPIPNSKPRGKQRKYERITKYTNNDKQE